MTVRGVLTLGLGLASGTAGLAGPVLESGPRPVALIELFTSEGCSSCPPAEAWLARLRDDTRLWTEFVPVAWHVDYWDNLGWRDPFARRAFTEREYAYARQWRAESVYTPCFVRDGREWRDRDLARDRLPDAGRLRGERDPRGNWRITFRPARPAADESFDVHVAWLGGGIASRVEAGENAGRTLTHEFVVLASETLPLRPEAGAGVFAATAAPWKGGADGITRRALAIWVTRRGELPPLQATGGWLD